MNNLTNIIIIYLINQFNVKNFRILFQPEQISLYEQHFPEESKKVPFSKLHTFVSGILVNTHPSMGFARALLPNTVEIGGYHIKEPEPLPEVNFIFN